MKNFYIPIAIILGALIISGTFYYNSKNDPLNRCIDRLVDKKRGDSRDAVWYAARACSGSK